MAAPRLTRRVKPEDEDASVLKLGPGKPIFCCSPNIKLTSVYAEFNNAGCLLISEVKYLLENRDKDAPDTAYASLFLSGFGGILNVSPGIQRVQQDA